MTKKIFIVIIIVVLCLFVACSKKANTKQDVYNLATEHLKQSTTVKEMSAFQEDKVKEMGSSSYNVTGWYTDANGIQHNYEIVMNKENGTWKPGYTVF